MNKKTNLETFTTLNETLSKSVSTKDKSLTTVFNIKDKSLTTVFTKDKSLTTVFMKKIITDVKQKSSLNSKQINDIKTKKLIYTGDKDICIKEIEQKFSFNK